MVEENLDLSKIKARYEAAAPEPWTYSGYEDNTEDDWNVYPPESCDDALGGYAGMTKANAEFIAAARTDIPALVTALEEAQELLHRVSEYGWTGAMGDVSEERDDPKLGEEIEQFLTNAILGESK